VRLNPLPAAILLAGIGTAALLARHVLSVAVIAGLLLAVCLRAPARRRVVYLYGALTTGLGVVVVSPFLQVTGSTVLWAGPIVPVLGPLDVTLEELEVAALNGLRLAALGLAFAAYTLLLDHDRLVSSVGFARRSALAVALATRLVPTLERDAAGFTEALRGRGVEVVGLRGHARLLSPLVSGSLERAWNLAESMEARGFGRPGATRAPRPRWTRFDRAAVGAAVLATAVGALWL
jgi:energy-coupling factor transport system permease protein